MASDITSALPRPAIGPKLPTAAARQASPATREHRHGDDAFQRHDAVRHRGAGAATPALKAGPLEASLDAGNLRHVKIAGREAIRAVSYIVRDRNWGTYNPEITDLRIDQDAKGFEVSYDAVCRDGEQAFAYRARITADPHGNLAFEAEGEALTDFVTNRTGFVVLHPVEGVSGAPVEVLHVDGAVERSRFPELIDPVCPFQDIRR